METGSRLATLCTRENESTEQTPEWIQRSFMFCYTLETE